MPPVFPVTGSSVSPVQKPQLWLADHCARVNVDKPGTFSDKTAGALAASVYCGQGEFPVPFGLPVLAKLVQAATSSSESAVSCALKVAGLVHSQDATVPVREQELDVDRVRCQGFEPGQEREVIRRILIIEFILIDRHPFGPQSIDLDISARTRMRADQIEHLLRSQAHEVGWVLRQNLCDRARGVRRAARILGATIASRDVGRVLRCRYWRLRIGEVFRNTDAKSRLVLNVSRP